MRTLFVVNPTAGGGRCGRRIGPVLDRLRHHGVQGEVATTQGPGDATHIARDAAAAGVQRVVVVGGDGTGFEVLNGLLPAQNPPVIAYLPLGTGNSFIRDLGITDAESAIRALLRGVSRPVDVLRATSAEDELYSINLISWGFTASAGELMNRRFKRLGAAGYVAGVVGRLATLTSPVVPLQIDGGPRDEAPITFVSACNSRCTGGTMQMAPDAQIDDGRMDVVRVAKMGRARLLTAFPRIFKGSHVDMDEVSIRQACTLTLHPTGPIDLMVDGEILRRTLRTVTVMPHAVQVVA